MGGNDNDIEDGIKTPLEGNGDFRKDEYFCYDNYPAFNVNKISEIPVEKDFEMIVTNDELQKYIDKGFDINIIKNLTNDQYCIKIINPVLGVPITFLDKYNPDQFEIVAFRKGKDGKDLVFTRCETHIQPHYSTSIASIGWTTKNNKHCTICKW